MYQYHDAFDKCITYFQGDELAAKVFLDKYVLRDNNGDLLEETPVQMHHRIAKEFARIENKKFKNPMTEEEIFSLMDGFKYVVPQGSPMFGIGNNLQIISLSNCYVVESPEDSYGGIMRVDEMLAQISKRRGGVGVDISKLRPANAIVKNAARSSTGITSWMERYSNTIREVGQSGRRGALMLSIHVAHKDVENFITIKNDDSKVTGANVSVLLSDEFLNAVENNEDFRLRFPIDAPPNENDKIVKARDLWKKIIHNAWLRAEPGLLFWDRVIKYNAVDCYTDEGYETISTNPCCFSKDSIVMVVTNNGIKEIKQITADDLIWVDDQQVWSKTSGYFDAGKAEVFKVTFSNNEELFITANHKLAKTKFKTIEDNVFVDGLELVELKDLVVDDEISIHINYISDCKFDTKVNNDQFVKIISIENVGIKDVGCIEVETYHRFTANGIISGNSELPLCAFDSCRLMVLNLFSYVVNPFTKDAYFDFNLFSKHGEIIQRLMDDMIDMELEKIQAIIEKIKKDPEEKIIRQRELDLWEIVYKKCENGRRTGTGITALGDTLAALNIPYGSKESIEITGQIMKNLCLSSFRSSCDIAKEIGAFPIWNWDKEKDSDFLQMIKENDPDLYVDISKYGRRNIANLTIAPTGSVSIMTQTTSGIEPLFMLNPYTRRKKVNPTDKNVRIDFKDQVGDCWQEFEVIHPKVAMWRKITGNNNLQQSPWFNCCAEDIDWIAAVQLQAEAQKYVDHAISKTVNLPEDVTEEQVAKIYEAAWKFGCKGMTVYRKNCRTGVLIEKPTKKEELISKIVKNDAPKRPSVIDAEVHFSMIKGEPYYVVVGLLESDPYEVFAGYNLNGDKPIIKKSLSNGKLKKKSRSNYVFITSDETFDLTNINNHENGDALCRMVSTALRHGASIEFVVHQLEKTKGDLASLSKVLARTFKKYIKDGTKVSGENCPNCKSDHIQRDDGCVICKDCGWSKCG